MLTRRFFALLILCPLLGCTAETADTTDSAPALDNSTANVSSGDSSDASVTATTTAGSTVTKETASVTAANDESSSDDDSSSTTTSSTDADSSESGSKSDSSDSDSSQADSSESTDTSDATTEEKPKELKTTDDYLEALRSKLNGVVPTPELIKETIALAEEGVAKLKNDKMMTVILGDLLFQTTRFEKDPELLKARRLRMGVLARQISSDKNFASLAQAMLYEEGKAHLADKDFEKTMATIMEARKLGFSDVRAFFLDPGYADLISSKEVAAEFKAMVKDSIREEIAEFKPFDFEFSLTSFDGKKVSQGDFAGKPLIVDFWGTWCGPCREVVPHLVKLTDKYKDKVAIMGVNLESNRGETPYLESRANFEEFVKNVQPINYTCVHGTYEFAQTIDGYEGKFPTMYFIDGNGKAVLKGDGYHPLEMLETTIEVLLENQKKSTAGA